MPEHRIILFGATGYTGRLVARELAATGAAFVLAGRDAAKLDRLSADVGGAPTAVADVNEPASLAALFTAGDVVIDCAGPFLELGEPVVRACIDAKAHCLDTTGEQAFMKLVLDRYHAAARAAGVVVVDGMAFEYALGDCAAAVAAEGLARPVRSVDVVYSWPSTASASRGTFRSILRILASPGLTWADGEWRQMAVAGSRTEVELPGGRRRAALAFPAGEILTVPRHVEARNVRAWIVVGRWTARLGTLAAPSIETLTRAATPLVDRMLAAAREGPSEERRGEGRFLVVVDAEGAYGARRRVLVRGRDAYGLTAAIAVRGARRVQELAERPPDARTAGVLAPAQVLEPRAFLDGLRDRGLSWEAMTA